MHLLIELLLVRGKNRQKLTRVEKGLIAHLKPGDG